MDETVVQRVFVVIKDSGKGGESEENANIPTGLESSLNISELM